MNVTEWMAHLKDVLMADQKRINRHRASWLRHYHHYMVTLSPHNALSYAEMCLEYTEAQVDAVLRAWEMRGPSQMGHRSRPALPGDILRELRGELFPEQEAALLAVKAWGLLASPGSGNIDEVKRRIGPEGAQCYELMGGVRQLCRQTNEEDRGSFIAQFRDMAVGIIVNRNRLRDQQTVAALPVPQPRIMLPEPAEAAFEPEPLQPERLPEPQREASARSVAQFAEMAKQLADKMAMQ